MKIPDRKLPMLILPRSMAKAVLLVLAAGLATGLAFYACTGPQLPYVSPFGDFFLLLYAFVCGLFGGMTALWALVAVLNRGNRKTAAFTASVAFLLAVVTISFFLHRP